MLEVEKGKPHDREGCERDVVELIDPAFVELLAWKGWVESEPVLWEHEYDVFVKVVENKEAVASVGFASVDEEERFQEPELSNRKVRTSGSLLPFKARDTDTHMGSSDHIYIVCPISNRESCLCWESVSHNLYDVCFLLGWDSAGKNNVHSFS